jgi:NAD(P)-dependent dehydrogenase (short-subunit alcohol dehydrogenase family)
MVSPGLIEDEGDDPAHVAFRRTLYQVDKIPMRRGGHPDEIAAAVVALALPSFGFFTGQVVHVNGGIYMP